MMESMLLSAMWWTRARVWPRRLQAEPPSPSQPPIRRHPHHHQVESVTASWALIQLLTCHCCLRQASLLVECPYTPHHCPHPRQVGSLAVSLCPAAHISASSSSSQSSRHAPTRPVSSPQANGKHRDTSHSLSTHAANQTSQEESSQTAQLRNGSDA